MKIEYGDKVRIRSGPHAGAEGWVSGLEKGDNHDPLLSVELEDGSVVRVPWIPPSADGEERVEKIPDPEAEAAQAAYDRGYAEGRDAHAAGLSTSDNPYDDWDDPRYDGWADGFRDAALGSSGGAS